MMKKILYSLFIACLAAVSCQMEEQFEGVSNKNNPIFSVASTVDIYSVEGGDDLITLTLKSEAKEWSLSQLSGSEWCRTSVIGGRTSTTIKLEVDPNEGAPRQSEILFSATGCKDTTLVINQMGLVKKAMPVDKVYNYGINYDRENNSVTLALYDIDTNGDCHDYCYLLGDFNGWAPSAEYAMYRDEAKKCWWYTLTDIEPAEEYMYQYCLGFIGEQSVRVCDPYTEIVYTKWDRTNLEKIYPNLPNYPDETSGPVSAFQMERPVYTWQHSWQNTPGDSGFKIEDKDDLIIYELWVRNFTEEGTLRALMLNDETGKSKLDYIQDLGVNVIELMPVQEFGSRNGWGYDPYLYFALDKDYGTREEYKAFIDECHRRGIAVFFDVVYNHLTDDSPLVKMYFNHCRTALNNPWFNQIPKHPHNVNRDMNHGDEFVKLHVKQSLKYLLEEYKIDGFRFDLTKGLTQTDSGDDDGKCSQYDQFRIDVLKGYYDAIQAVNKEAVMICEHFCWDDEQRVLAQHGIKVWRQLNSPYAQAAMGHQNDSDFSGFHTDNTQMPFGSYVSFMESHDEERLCYKQTKWGNGAAKTDLKVRMDRAGLCAAFNLLVPGPKMIWQFGELGYDYSINQNEKGEFHETEEGGYRTSMKPLCWDYYDDGVEGSGEDEIRRGLFDTYSKLLAFRKKNSDYYDAGAEFRWYVSVDNWPGRYLFIKSTDGANMALFGNFGSGDQTIGVELPHDGIWYNAFTGDTWNGAHHNVPMKEGKFYLLVDNRDDVISWNEGAEPKPEEPDTPGTDNVETDGVIYLKVNGNWLTDGARFAAYFYGGSGDDIWMSMTADVEADVFKCDVPKGYGKVVFVRLNPDSSANNWDEGVKWNQTGDQSVMKGKCFVLDYGSWDSGSWSSYPPGSGSEPEDPEEQEACEWYLIGEHQGWTFGADKVTPLYKVEDDLFVARNLDLKDAGFKLTQKDNTSWDNVFGSHSGDYKYIVGTDGWYTGIYTDNRGDKSNNIKLSDWSGPFDVYIRYVQVGDWGKELGFAIVKAGDPYPQY